MSEITANIYGHALTWDNKRQTRQGGRKLSLLNRTGAPKREVPKRFAAERRSSALPPNEHSTLTIFHVDWGRRDSPTAGFNTKTLH